MGVAVLVHLVLACLPVWVLYVVACSPVLLYALCFLFCRMLRTLRQWGWKVDSTPGIAASKRQAAEPPIMDQIPLEEQLDFFVDRNPTYPLAMLCSQVELLGRQLEKPTGLTVLSDADFASTFSDSFIAL